MATFTIRIPDTMRTRIKAFAEADKRSMNGEVEWLLEEALKARESSKVGRAAADKITKRP